MPNNKNCDSVTKFTWAQGFLKKGMKHYHPYTLQSNWNDDGNYNIHDVKSLSEKVD